MLATSLALPVYLFFTVCRNTAVVIAVAVAVAVASGAQILLPCFLPPSLSNYRIGAKIQLPKKGVNKLELAHPLLRNGIHLAGGAVFQLRPDLHSNLSLSLNLNLKFERSKGGKRVVAWVKMLKFT